MVPPAGAIASHVTQTVEPLAKEVKIAIALEIAGPAARIRGDPYDRDDLLLGKSAHIARLSEVLGLCPDLQEISG